MDVSQYKTCSSCKQVLPLEQFNRHKWHRDGLHSQCKTCTRAGQKRSQARHRDQYLARERLRGARRRQNADRQAYDRQYHKRWRAANRDKQRLYEQRWRAKHPDTARAKDRRHTASPQRKASSRLYRATHREQIRAQQRRYWAANPERGHAYRRRRSARVWGAPINDLTAAQWRAIKAHYGQRCVYCGKKFQRLTQDHITPLSKGGAHTASNVVPACRSCNSCKRAGPPLVPVQPLLGKELLSGDDPPS